jgi:hypothetical protein
MMPHPLALTNRLTIIRRATATVFTLVILVLR